MCILYTESEPSNCCFIPPHLCSKSHTITRSNNYLFVAVVHSISIKREKCLKDIWQLQARLTVFCKIPDVFVWNSSWNTSERGLCKIHGEAATYRCLHFNYSNSGNHSSSDLGVDCSYKTLFAGSREEQWD